MGASVTGALPLLGGATPLGVPTPKDSPTPFRAFLIFFALIFYKSSKILKVVFIFFCFYSQVFY